jgi:NTP pyrophosphatase (non-canonical NTP hydrolase)
MKIPELITWAHKTATDKGWHDEEHSGAHYIGLMHGELSEALEYMRDPELPCDHLPDKDPVAVELADCIIRIFDYCGEKNLNLESAIIKKMQYNETRPHKHGKRF